MKRLTTLDATGNELFTNEIDSQHNLKRHLNYKEEYGFLMKEGELNLNHIGLIKFPSMIRYLINLKFLDISNNNLLLLPEYLDELIHIESFLCRNVNLQLLPKNFGNLKKISILDLSNNQLTTLPESIENLTNLTELDISQNPISLSERTRLLEVFGKKVTLYNNKIHEFLYYIKM